MSRTFYTNGYIIDVLGEQIYQGSILAENGIIQAVGADLACPDNTEVVDFGGGYVSPGLFNCHTHMILSGEANPDYNVSDARLTIAAIANCRREVHSGVTFMRDLGSAHYIDLDVRAAAARGEITAPEMQVSGRYICMTGGHGWNIGRESDGADECRKAAREQLRAGVDWIKVMATGGVMTRGVEPGSPQLNEDELRAAIEEGHKVGVRSATHAQGMTGVKNALQAGVDSIEHGFYLDDWCYAWMKEHNTYYVPTLAAMYWIKVRGVKAGIADWVVRKVEAAFDAHKASFYGAYKAGVRIALGTDAGTPFNTHDKTAYEMVLMEEAGMDAWTALRSGTSVAAELCGVIKDHGTIAPGKVASFTVYGGDPLADIHHVMDCRMTVVRGNVLYHAE